MAGEQTAYEGWTIVEQLGHKTIAGFVREQLVAGVPLLRIDVPAADPGVATPAATQFIHASTVYALTPTTEQIVRAVAARTRVEPAATWGMAAAALPPGRPGDDDLDAVDEDDPVAELEALLDAHGLDGVLVLLIQFRRDVAD